MNNDHFFWFPLLSFGYKNTVGAVACLFFFDPPLTPYAIKAAEYVFWHLLLKEGYHDHVPTESWHCQNFLAQAIAPHTSPNFGTGLCATCDSQQTKCFLDPR